MRGTLIGQYFIFLIIYQAIFIFLSFFLRTNIVSMLQNLKLYMLLSQQVSSIIFFLYLFVGISLCQCVFLSFHFSFFSLLQRKKRTSYCKWNGKKAQINEFLCLSIGIGCVCVFVCMCKNVYNV